jgi:hypothetical protein
MSNEPVTLEAVRVLQIPVAIWARAQEQIDELLREFTLIAARLRELPEPAGVPLRLLELVEQLTAQFGGLNIDQENQLSEAAAEGVAELDLVYQVPPAAADGAKWLRDVLDESDAYCEAGEHLLTLAASPELRRFRCWFLDEFINQLHGADPTPFPDYEG